MTQVFADDDQIGDLGMLAHNSGQIPAQGGYHPLPVLGPAMTAGKGVRPIRCVGCSRDTLPRHGDGAPLCHRCSERLASTGISAGTGAVSSMSWPIMSLAPRWRRRRPHV
jgi:hypothetical protein